VIGVRYHPEMQPTERPRDLSDLVGSLTPDDARAIQQLVEASDEEDLAGQAKRDLSFMGGLTDNDALAIEEAHQFCDRCDHET
jgi:hypothetical protein